jgi:predicted nucleic acid-binding protein
MQQIFPGRQNLFEAAPIRGYEALVLDTNVVLDLLVFQDAGCASLAATVAATPGQWHATRRMREEFDAVLARPEFGRMATRRTAALQGWAAWATMVLEEPPLARHDLECRDRDDQMFLDLAAHLRPCTLFSRDAEVLRLRRRAALLGIRITTPTAAYLSAKEGAAR